MHQELYREKNIHGSVMFPFECYIQDSKEPVLAKNYHWHEEVEWIYIKEGFIVVEIDMSAFRAGPDSFVCIPRGALHKIRTEGKCLYYAFVYKFQFLQFASYDYCESNYMIPLEKGEIVLSQQHDLRQDENKAVKLELDGIVEAYLHKGAAWQMTVKASLVKIVALFMRQNSIEKTDLENKAANIGKVENMKSLLAYIRSHYSEKIYIKDLAEIVSMNETYFCRYFKSITGKTPIAYINQFRIEKAAKLIRETDYRMIDICFLVGFDNVSYFIRVFKEMKKMTPKKYSEAVNSSQPGL